LVDIESTKNSKVVCKQLIKKNITTVNRIRIAVQKLQNIAEIWQNNNEAKIGRTCNGIMLITG
jgi:hypothetical protein